MTTELIKIKQENGKKLVSGRELHEFLEVGTRFDKWFPRMTEYGFEENVDYVVTDIFVPNSKGGKQTQIDYAISINMAKEISMIQRTDKGKEARQYFIECEKQLLQISEKDRLLLGLFSDDKLTVAESHKQLVKIEVGEAIAPLISEIKENKPRVDFAKSVEVSVTSLDFKKFSDVLGIKNFGRNKLFEWMRNQEYLNSRNEPYRRYIEQGLFETKESTYVANGVTKISIVSFITSKGQIYFQKKINEYFNS